MVLRQAIPDDVDVLQGLMRLSVAELSRGYYSAEEIASAVECITIPDLDLIADGTLIVAEDAGELVACGAWSRRRKLYTGSAPGTTDGEYLEPGVDPAKIRAFFVHPDLAGRGLARMIYEECEKQALAHGFSAFELMATMPGVPLYQKLGFTSGEPADIVLSDGTRLAGLTMWKRLDRHP